MTSHEITIALISDDTEVSAAVARAFGNRRDLSLVAHESTLTQMNGTAVRMAADHDVVIFKTEADTDRDIEAIATLRAGLAAGHVLLALTNDSMSLADARRLMKAGVNEVLAYPLTEGELVGVIDRWSRPAAPVPALIGAAARFGQVIAVCPSRGGAGASTLAVNLAERLRMEKGTLRKTQQYRVALVDLDLQFGSVASLLDLEPNEALYSMANSDLVPDAVFLRQAMVEAMPGLDVLTAPRQLAPLDALDRGQIASLLDYLRADHDFVVVDLPRTLVPWVAAVLERADKLMLVTDSTVPAIRQSRRLLDFFLEEVPTLAVDIVMNQERKPLIPARHHSEAAKVLERPLAFWIPQDVRAARASVDRGATLSAVAGRAPMSKAISAISRSIISDAIKSRGNFARANA